MPDAHKKFYLTTPIYYVNARPHIGHAYTTIAADVIARRHRLLGDDTFFLTGTDEHGQKIERSAAAAGIPPQQFADQVSASFENLWKRMGITNSAFIRTTDPRHKRGVQKLWKTLADRGAIYLSTYTGQYSVGEEMFVEGPPGTIGPDGKPTETVTEENYFFRLSDYQLRLIDLIESGELSIQPEVRRNEVLSFLRGNVAAVVTEVYDREVGDGAESPQTRGGGIDTVKIASEEGRLRKSAAGTPYVPGALKDLSISRSSFKWGIPVPGPQQGQSEHVVYVWLDALANYMTAIGYGSEDPADIAQFEKCWPADLHLVGKEIIRFHCVYWPAFLMAAGLKLPKAITAHGWLLFEDSKMSKSRGNIVRTETILDAFGPLCPPVPLRAEGPPNTSLGRSPREGEPPDARAESPTHAAPAPPTKAQQDLFAADILRYFLLREIPFGQDGSFSFDALITRYNADLANGYGNLVSRTLNMVNAYFGGSVPHPPGSRSAEGPEVSIAIRTKMLQLVEVFEREKESHNFSNALSQIAGLIADTDRFLSDQTPWKLAKLADEFSRNDLQRVLYIASSSIHFITALLYPFLPYATASVWAQLGLGSIEEAARKGELKNLQWGGLKPGTKLGPLAPIFPRADKGLAQLMTDMESPAPPPPTPASPEIVKSVVSPSPTETKDTPIAIDDFLKVDLRVAQIVVAERIPKADKLLRLEVDLGYERRQILSGIAQWYTPGELIGRRIAVIANLAPRKMRGLDSHGMLLAASDESDPAAKPILATFSDEVPLGSRIR